MAQPYDFGTSIPPVPSLGISDLITPPTSITSLPPQTRPGGPLSHIEAARILEEKARQYGIPIEIAMALWNRSGQSTDPQLSGGGPMSLRADLLKGVDALDMQMDASMRELQKAYARYHDWSFALRAYATGIPQVDKEVGGKAEPSPKGDSFLINLLQGPFGIIPVAGRLAVDIGKYITNPSERDRYNRILGTELLPAIEREAPAAFTRAASFGTLGPPPPPPRNFLEQLVGIGAGYAGFGVGAAILALIPGVGEALAGIPFAIRMGVLAAAEDVLPAFKGEVAPEAPVEDFAGGLTFGALLRIPAFVRSLRARGIAPEDVQRYIGQRQIAGPEQPPPYTGPTRPGYPPGGVPGIIPPPPPRGAPGPPGPFGRPEYGPAPDVRLWRGYTPGAGAEGYQPPPPPGVRRVPYGQYPYGGLQQPLPEQPPAPPPAPTRGPIGPGAGGAPVVGFPEAQLPEQFRGGGPFGIPQPQPPVRPPEAVPGVPPAARPMGAAPPARPEGGPQTPLRQVMMRYRLLSLGEARQFVIGRMRRMQPRLPQENTPEFNQSFQRTVQQLLREGEEPTRAPTPPPQAPAPRGPWAPEGAPRPEIPLGRRPWPEQVEYFLNRLAGEGATESTKATIEQEYRGTVDFLTGRRRLPGASRFPYERDALRMMWEKYNLGDVPPELTPKPGEPGVPQAPVRPAPTTPTPAPTPTAAPTDEGVPRPPQEPAQIGLEQPVGPQYPTREVGQPAAPPTPAPEAAPPTAPAPAPEVPTPPREGEVTDTASTRDLVTAGAPPEGAPALPEGVTVNYHLPSGMRELWDSYATRNNIPEDELEQGHEIISDMDEVGYFADIADQRGPDEAMVRLHRRAQQDVAANRMRAGRLRPAAPPVTGEPTPPVFQPTPPETAPTAPATPPEVEPEGQPAEETEDQEWLRESSEAKAKGGEALEFYEQGLRYRVTREPDSTMEWEEPVKGKKGETRKVTYVRPGSISVRMNDITPLSATGYRSVTPGTTAEIEQAGGLRAYVQQEIESQIKGKEWRTRLAVAQSRGFGAPKAINADEALMLHMLKTRPGVRITGGIEKYRGVPWVSIRGVNFPVKAVEGTQVRVFTGLPDGGSVLVPMKAIEHVMTDAGVGMFGRGNREWGMPGVMPREEKIAHVQGIRTAVQGELAAGRPVYVEGFGGRLPVVGLGPEGAPVTPEEAARGMGRTVDWETLHVQAEGQTIPITSRWIDRVVDAQGKTLWEDPRIAEEAARRGEEPSEEGPPPEGGGGLVPTEPPPTTPTAPTTPAEPAPAPEARPLDENTYRQLARYAAGKRQFTTRDMMRDMKKSWRELQPYIDRLEDESVIGPAAGNQPRPVLMDQAQLERHLQGIAPGEREFRPLSDDPQFEDIAKAIVEKPSLAGVRQLSGKDSPWKMGHARASQLLKKMEDLGIVGPPRGKAPRQVLVDPGQLARILRREPAGEPTVQKPAPAPEPPPAGQPVKVSPPALTEDEQRVVNALQVQIGPGTRVEIEGYMRGKGRKRRPVPMLVPQGRGDRVRGNNVVLMVLQRKAGIYGGVRYGPQYSKIEVPLTSVLKVTRPNGEVTYDRTKAAQGQAPAPVDMPGPGTPENPLAKLQAQIRMPGGSAQRAQAERIMQIILNAIQEAGQPEPGIAEARGGEQSEYAVGVLENKLAGADWAKPYTEMSLKQLRDIVRNVRVFGKFFTTEVGEAVAPYEGQIPTDPVQLAEIATKEIPGIANAHLMDTYRGSLKKYWAQRSQVQSKQGLYEYRKEHQTGTLGKYEGQSEAVVQAHGEWMMLQYEFDMATRDIEHQRELMEMNLREPPTFEPLDAVPTAAEVGEAMRGSSQAKAAMQDRLFTISNNLAEQMTKFWAMLGRTLPDTSNAKILQTKYLRGAGGEYIKQMLRNLDATEAMAAEVERQGDASPGFLDYLKGILRRMNEEEGEQGFYNPGLFYDYLKRKFKGGMGVVGSSSRTFDETMEGVTKQWRRVGARFPMQQARHAMSWATESIARKIDTGAAIADKHREMQMQQNRFSNGNHRFKLQLDRFSPQMWTEFRGHLKNHTTPTDPAMRQTVNEARDNLRNIKDRLEQATSPDPVTGTPRPKFWVPDLAAHEMAHQEEILETNTPGGPPKERRVTSKPIKIPANWYPQDYKPELLVGNDPYPKVLKLALQHEPDPQTARVVAERESQRILRSREHDFGTLGFAKFMDRPIPDYLQRPIWEVYPLQMQQIERAAAAANVWGEHRPMGKYGFRYAQQQAMRDQAVREAETYASQVTDNPDRHRAEVSEIMSAVDILLRDSVGENMKSEIDRSISNDVQQMRWFQMMGQMGVSWMWKLTQPAINGPTRYGARSFMQAVMEFVGDTTRDMRGGGREPIIVRTPRGFRINMTFIERARASGALQENVWDRMARSQGSGGGRLAQMYFDYNLFRGTVLFSRAMAASMARHEAEKHFARVMAGRGEQRIGIGAKSNHIMDQLLGPRRLAAAKARGQLNTDDILAAEWAGSEQVEFYPGARTLPPAWTQTSGGKMWSIFHGFSFEQSRLIFDHVWNELTKHGNLWALVSFLPLTLGVGAAAAYYHNAVTGRQRPHGSAMGELYDHFVNKKPMPEHGAQFVFHMIQDATGWAGMGLIGSVLHDLGVFPAIAGEKPPSPERAMEVVTGPIMSQAAMTAYYAASSLRQEMEIDVMHSRPEVRRDAAAMLWRNLIHMVPIVGQMATSAGAGDLFITPHEHYLRVRNAAMAAFDAGNLGDFIALNGELMDLGAPITSGELHQHIRRQTVQQYDLGLGDLIQPTTGPMRALPGEPGYVRGRR